MAVQKSKKSVSKKKKKLINNIKNISLSIDKECNELHLRHHSTKSGYYKGNKINLFGV